MKFSVAKLMTLILLIIGLILGSGLAPPRLMAVETAGDTVAVPDNPVESHPASQVNSGDQGIPVDTTQNPTIPVSNKSLPKTNYVPAATEVSAPQPSESPDSDPQPNINVSESTKPTASGFSWEQFWLAAGDWWNNNSLNLQFWYLFFLVVLLLYLFKLKSFRRPVLLIGLVLLGFYLKGSFEPVTVLLALLKRIEISSLIFLAVIIGTSLIWGRFFCGWLCPLGAVQELIHPAGKQRSLPAATDQTFKYLKYLTLAGLIYLALRYGNHLWLTANPSGVLFKFTGSIIIILIVLGFLLLSMLLSRPFCRYFCPLGAILAITARLAPFKMRTDSQKCMVCSKCLQGTCQMGAIKAFNPIIDLPEVDSAECINCLECIDTCKRSALQVTGRRIDRSGRDTETTVATPVNYLKG